VTGQSDRHSWRLTKSPYIFLDSPYTV